MAFHTWLAFPLLAQKRKGKGVRQRLSSHSRLTSQDIGMRHLVIFNCFLKMFLYLVMTDDLLKIQHRSHLTISLILRHINEKYNTLFPFSQCSAFQIGKICCHHCTIRHFPFRKCLPCALTIGSFLPSFHLNTVCNRPDTHIQFLVFKRFRHIQPL